MRKNLFYTLAGVSVLFLSFCVFQAIVNDSRNEDSATKNSNQSTKDKMYFSSDAWTENDLKIAQEELEKRDIDTSQLVAEEIVSLWKSMNKQEIEFIYKTGARVTGVE